MNHAPRIESATLRHEVSRGRAHDAFNAWIRALGNDTARANTAGPASGWR
jgi:hypothetical protein